MGAKVRQQRGLGHLRSKVVRDLGLFQVGRDYVIHCPAANAEKGEDGRPPDLMGPVVERLEALTTLTPGDVVFVARLRS